VKGKQCRKKRRGLLCEEICRILLNKAEKDDEKFSVPLADVD
jgi:hypothetical protein